MKLEELEHMVQSHVYEFINEQEDDNEEEIDGDQEEETPQDEPPANKPEPEPETEPEKEPTRPSKPSAPAQKLPPTKRVISREEAAALVRNSKGRFFTISFTKKDGTNRIMNARLGVKAYLKGGELPYDARAKGLLPVYDIQKKGYRIINLRTVNGLKIGSSTYKVE